MYAVIQEKNRNYLVWICLVLQAERFIKVLADFHFGVLDFLWFWAISVFWLGFFGSRFQFVSIFDL